MKNLPLLLTFALAPQVGADLVISEVDLATGQVEIVNTGDASVDMTSYRWCNRVNGAPSFYPGVSAATINEALSTASSLDVGPGQLLVFDLPVTFLPATGGELGLYLPSAAGGFGSRNAMVDYVNWGDSTGVRDSAADDDPAIWETNAAIDVSGAGAGDTIQLKAGTPGDSVNDYEIAASTIGAPQVAPPVELVIDDIGFADSATLFVEFTYTGAGSVSVSESADLSAFSAVSDRTVVSMPSENRIEFAAPNGDQFYFRLEEE